MLKEMEASKNLVLRETEETAVDKEMSFSSMKNL